jgi:hypothetical protein
MAFVAPEAAGAARAAAGARAAGSGGARAAGAGGARGSSAARATHPAGRKLPAPDAGDVADAAGAAGGGGGGRASAPSRREVPRSVVRGWSAANDGAGALLALIAYGPALAFVQGGPTRAKAWFRAKFLNEVA